MLLACFTYALSHSLRRRRGVLLTAQVIRQHTSAYVSIRQHTSAYVSIRQHTSAFSSQLKSKVGHILAKAAALRMNLKIDGAPIAFLDHTLTQHIS
jgi:hypothetical protein